MRITGVLAFSLLAWFFGYSHLLAHSDAAIRELRAHRADVRWVTEGGLLEGHATSLPEEEYHYSVTIREDWTGGNRGLARLRNLARLKVLRIDNAPGVDDHGLAQIGELATVEEFYLQRVRVSDKRLGFLHSLPRLRSLCLQYLPITDAALAGLGELMNLESVNLGSLKRVGDKTVVVLERLPGLRELNLARTGVSDAGIQHLNRRLESLNLFETQVTDDGMKSLERLKKLKHLDLTGTRISDKGLAYLARLPELESLYVGGTAVTETGIAGFVKARRSTRPIKVVH